MKRLAILMLECSGGWQPDRCTGECGRSWCDPDYEYDKRRDEPPEPYHANDF